jgi:DNA-directed RNA polymerase specialized sigma24 family protein
MTIISQGSGNQSNLKTLSDLELVDLIAGNSQNSQAFEEFICRFEELIQFHIYRTCRNISYSHGLTKIEDLTQDVYELLIENYCAKLKQIKTNVRGFLSELACNTVRNDRRKHLTHKRWPVGGVISLNKEIADWSVSERRKLMLIETIPDYDDSRLRDLIDEIRSCLEHIVLHNRNRERNILILMCYLFEDLEPDEIVLHHRVDLSVKRTENLIAEIMQGLRQCLQRRGYGKMQPA